jgi:hypothetical protein
MKKIVFNQKEYGVAFDLSDKNPPDSTVEAYEWITNNESIDNWTTLITTHLLIPKDITRPMSAEVYAQNVMALLTQSGALVLETSLINQDIETLGIDPARAPYILVFMFNQNGITEFNMQKIVQLDNGKVGSILYGEKFPTKSEPDMKAYYDSDERTSKRAELIRMPFPYDNK